MNVTDLTDLELTNKLIEWHDNYHKLMEEYRNNNDITDKEFKEKFKVLDEEYEVYFNETKRRQ